MKNLFKILLISLLMFSFCLSEQFIEYYDDGQIRKKSNYKDGKAQGKWTWYYENGQVKVVGYKKNGWKNGKWIWYYKNGKTHSEGTFKNWETRGAMGLNITKIDV